MAVALPDASLLKDVINWAQSQLDYETANSQPAPLTAEQRKALQELHHIVTPKKPLGQEPDVSQRDWISLLNRYRQAHPVASGQAIEFHDSAVEGTLDHLKRWTCHVTIDEHSQPFPSGVNEEEEEEAGDGVPPSFGRKKDARQYAAKCAVQWLMKGNYMPSNGNDVTFPKGFVQPRITPVITSSTSSHSVASPAAKRQKINPSDSSPPPPPPPPQIVQAPAAVANGQALYTDGKDVTPSFAQQVVELCNKLGAKAPSYKISSSNDDNNGGITNADTTFSGHAELCDRLQARGLPGKSGHVRGVRGSKLIARETIADEVLRDLQRFLAESDALFDELVKDLSPVRPGG